MTLLMTTDNEELHWTAPSEDWFLDWSPSSTLEADPYASGAFSDVYRSTVYEGPYDGPVAFDTNSFNSNSSSLFPPAYDSLSSLHIAHTIPSMPTATDREQPLSLSLTQVMERRRIRPFHRDARKKFSSPSLPYALQPWHTIPNNDLQLAGPLGRPISIVIDALDECRPLEQDAPGKVPCALAEHPHKVLSASAQRRYSPVDYGPLNPSPLVGFNASGGFSDIHSGRRGGNTVALKSIRVTKTSRDYDRYHQMLLSNVAKLSKLSHPNLLPVLGLFDLGNETLPAVVTPWQKNGNIKQYLSKSPETDRMRMMMSIAGALSYLHSQDVVHGDLKANNILVGDRGEALVSDFGLSAIYEGVSDGMGPTLGSVRYQAPEIILGDVRQATKASDVYSFSAIFYEILTGVQPFSNLATLVDIVLAHYEAEKPFNHADVRIFESRDQNQALWDLSLSCWDGNPDGRPKMHVIYDALAALQNKSSPPLRQAHL